MISTAAIVLRARPYKERDLLLDLLTLAEGRISLVARGAQKSKRRYMGSLELGARVKIDYRPKLGLGTLGPCDLLSAPWQARRDLGRLAQLCYLLELLRCTSPLGEADAPLFESACAYLDHLESETEPSEEGLLRWELALMSHLGYALRIDRCPYTGEAPDAISYRVGGSFSLSSGRRGHPLPTPLLRILYQIQRGREIPLLSQDDRQRLRQALAAVWSEIIGVPLKSVAFFQTAEQLYSTKGEINVSVS